MEVQSARMPLIILEMIVGGQSFVINQQDYIRDFKISYTSDGISTSQGSVTLYDHTYDYIDRILTKPRIDKVQLKISYGWSHDQTSKLIVAEVTKITPSYTFYASELVLEFIQKELVANPFYEMYSTAENKISDVVKQIGRNQGWDVSDVTTTSTNQSLPQVLIPRGQTAMQFISYLAQLAVTPEGLGDFIAYIDNSNGSGKPKLHFRPKNTPSTGGSITINQVLRTYYWPSVSGLVISLDFTTDMIGTNMLMPQQIVGVDDREKRTWTFTGKPAADYKATQQSLINNLLKSEPARVLFRKTNGEPDASPRTQAINNLAFQVTITVMGDPTFLNHNTVRLIVYKPDHTVSKLSGIYLITETSHEISAGKFTTTLKGSRQDSLILNETVKPDSVEFRRAVSGGIYVAPVDRSEVDQHVAHAMDPYLGAESIVVVPQDPTE